MLHHDIDEQTAYNSKIKEYIEKEASKHMEHGIKEGMMEQVDDHLNTTLYVLYIFTCKCHASSVIHYEIN